MNSNHASLLTVPERFETYDINYLTGNEYISLPEISSTGEIKNVNILRLDYRGLLEFSGRENEALIEPLFRVNDLCSGKQYKYNWIYKSDWLPCFKIETSTGVSAEGLITAPPGQKGFLYRLTVYNNKRVSIEIELGWRGTWAVFNYIVFNRREMEIHKSVTFNSWTRSLIFEASSGLPHAAMALAADPEMKWQFSNEEYSYLCSSKFALAPGEKRETVLYAAVNLEMDGAGTTCLDLRRQGYKQLVEITENWLESRRVTDHDSHLEQILNRNMYFCFFYAAGRCLESEKIALVTSRSPRYYVSAAFWSRDALLWSFPALLMVDSETAREALLTAFKRHIKNAGDHAHYINGTLLYPGFELDQLAAYIICLDNYTRVTGDLAVIDSDLIINGLDHLAEKALHLFDPRSGLYSTFLDPSDDPVIYPYLTYSNALLQRAFTHLGRLQFEGKWQGKGDFAILSRELTQAIYEHCVVKGPYGPMFAWSVDGRGKFQLYDNPPGSLQLLAHYGFCSLDESIFRNTVCWIRSANNKFFNQGCSFEEAGSVHAEGPWPLAACNDLLACNSGAESFIKKTEMDNGFFCETVDPESGLLSTGAAFASGAGFLAYALKNRAGYENRCHKEQFYTEEERY